MTSQYQNKQVRGSGILRPKYGVIRGIHLGNAASKKWVIYNGTDDSGREIQTIAYPNNPISQHDINIPFDSLFVSVEDEQGVIDENGIFDSPDARGAALTILID